MTTWVLVASRNGARIFNRGEDQLESIEELAHPGSPAADLQLEPGHEAAASRFALKVAAHLERERQRGSLRQLVVVAEAGFLEHLRTWLSKHVVDLVVASIATDLSALWDAELEPRLATALAS